MNFESILPSFSLGLLATLSPCVLPLYPGFLAYLSGQTPSGASRSRWFLGFFVLLGVLTMMLLLGLIIALLSISVGSALSIIIPLADLVILLLGLLLLFDKNPFKALPQVRVPFLRSPFLNAFVYGLLYGPLALPCSGAFIVGIFSYSLSATDFFSKLILFLFFGLGFGLPLLLLSLLSGAFQKSLTRWFARHSRIINIVGGLLLIALAIYDFFFNWEYIRLFLGL